MEGNLHGDARSVTGLALDLQVAAHRLRALAHVEESEMSRGRWLSGSKALAIIAHGEANRGRLEPQLDGNMPGASVLHGVGNGFLPDTEQVHLHWRREGARASLNLEVSFGLLARNEWLDNLGQRRNQVSIFQQLAAQIPHRTARLHHAVTAHVARRLQRMLGHTRRLLKAIDRQIQLHGDPGQFLFQRVV